MKRIFLLLITIFPNLLYSQDWMMSGATGGTGSFTTIDIKLDQQNNKYLVGTFTNQILIQDQVFNSRGLTDILLIKFSKSGDLIWAEQIGSSLADLCAGIVLDESSIYLSGSFKDSLVFSSGFLKSINDFDFFLAKYDFDKNLIWAKSVGYGPKQQRSNYISMDSYGDLLISGVFQDSIYFDTDTLTAKIALAGFYAKFSTNGNLIWAKPIDGKNIAAIAYILSSASFSDINYFTGYFKDTLYINTKQYNSLGGLDLFLFKTDANGNILWNRVIGGLGTEIGTSVTTDGYGNAFLGAYTSSDNLKVDSTETHKSQINYIRLGSNDFLLTKYELDGTLSWNKLYGNSGDDRISFVYFKQNLIHFTGYYSYQFTFGGETIQSNGTLDRNAFLAGIGTDGTPKYLKNITGSGSYDDQGFSMDADNLGNINLAGHFKSPQLHIGDSTYVNVVPGNNMGFIAEYGCLPITLSSQTPTDVKCYKDANGTIAIGASGGFTQLLYSKDGTTFLANNGTFTNLAPGNYTITVKDSVSCSVKSNLLTIAEPDSLTFAGTSANPLCYNFDNGKITFTPSGGTPAYHYSIDGGATLLATPVVSGLAPGEYNLLVKDANDCVSDTATVTLTQPTALDFTFRANYPLCNGAQNGSISFTPAGGTPSYRYSTDGGTVFVNNSTIAGLGSAEYQLLVKDANDCLTDSRIFTLYEPEVLTFTFIPKNPLCNGTNDGEVSFTPAGGIPEYSYSTDGGTSFSANSTISSLAPGGYTLAVKDANDCLTLGDITVLTEPPALLVNLESKTDITNTQEGEIVVSSSGGTAPYSYTLSPGDISQSTGTFPITTGGDYIVEVKDGNNCGPVSTDPITIANYTGVSTDELLKATIYPNPSGGMVTIEMRTDKHQVQLELFSMTGQVMLSRKAFVAGGKMKESLDLTGFAKGTYLMKVDGQTLSSGIVIK